ncbi:hypothetical protein PITCH_A210002 [uncultured Desulfobacterium sp.]|uniref:Uncharacterized protein n=1 Tax=uncultured Desulfobacterium sp. TaxID=201089 RepID=A0A445MXG8_9BACT|nr:hypothetical protein PITCH_A210002 [uncultured Desulfobacterium sp.]
MHTSDYLKSEQMDTKKITKEEFEILEDLIREHGSQVIHDIIREISQKIMYEHEL